MPGSGSSISSSQIVIYIGFIDESTGQRIADGLTVFDSRVYSAQYFGVDNGPGGTGAAVYNQPAGYQTNFETNVSGAASFEGAAWSGFQTFDLQITPANLENLIAVLNNGNTGQLFSTDVSQYKVDQVSIDSEVEYFGQPNSIGYSFRNLDVSTGSVVSALAGTDQVGNSYINANHV